jgi:hypothetical protein
MSQSGKATGWDSDSNRLVAGRMKAWAVKKILASSPHVKTGGHRSSLVSLLLLLGLFSSLSLTADDYVECPDPLPDAFLPCRESCREHVANIVANLSQKSTPLSPQAIKQIVRFPLGQEQSSHYHLFQVSLERPAIDVRAKALKVLDGQATVLQDVLDGLCLSIRKTVLLDQDIALYGQLPTLFDFGQLGGQALDKILQPSGHVQIAFANALNRPIERTSIPVVILADCKQTLEVVPGPIEIQCREQS